MIAEISGLTGVIAVLAVIFAFALSAWLTWCFCDPRSRLYILDHPNARSLHSHPTPRGGGVAIVVAIVTAGLLIGIAYSALADFLWLGTSLLMLAIVSFLDDRYGLQVTERLLAHIAVACLLLVEGFILYTWQWPGVLWHWSPWLGVGFSLLFILWMINLYNFMDGMDGLAAGMTVIGFSFFAWFGWAAENPLFFSVSLAIAAAGGGFLVFNFPPARIFMGDVGSSLLGLSAAVLSLWGAQEGMFPFWAAILIFSPFIVDATITLVRRMVRRERFWEAHKTHYYQRLVQLGWSHRKTVLWEYGLMLACGGTALWMVQAEAGTQRLVLAFWVMVYCLLALLVPYLERRRKKRQN